MDVAPPSPPSKARVFWRRLASTVTLWAVVLGAMFSGNEGLSHAVFVLLMVLLAALGLIEFYGLAARRGLVCFPRFGVTGGVALMGATFLHLKGWLGIHDSPARVNDFETSLLILFVLGLCVRQLVARDNPRGLEAMATTLFGLLEGSQRFDHIVVEASGVADPGRIADIAVLDPRLARDGVVVVVDADSVTVACADGRIKLTRVQADGPKVGAGEWAAAAKIEKGARFT